MPRIKSFFTKLFLFAKTHKKFLIIPIILLIIFGFVLFPKKKVVIATTPVKSGELVQSISVNGTLESETSVKLTFLAGGKLVYLGYKEGDSVKTGSVIANLDQRSATKNLQSALATYAQQRNTFDQTKDDNKDKPLTDSLNRILADNQYDLDKASISVDLQDLARQQSVLTTPIAGILTRQDVSVIGVNVTPATIFEVTDPSSMEFRMEVDEADIGKIKEGQSVKANLDSYPDEDLTLTIDHIDFATHTTSTGGDAYYVKAKLDSDNSNYKFRVGMNGNAEIILDKKEDVLLIPLSSIFDDNKVYVKNGKKYEKRTVKLGVQNDTDTQVLEGLNKDEEVVIDPSLVK
jgi:RND family efflux transporter MFP subunit